MRYGYCVRSCCPRHPSRSCARTRIHWSRPCSTTNCCMWKHMSCMSTWCRRMRSPSSSPKKRLIRWWTTTRTSFRSTRPPRPGIGRRRSNSWRSCRRSLCRRWTSLSTEPMHWPWKAWKMMVPESCCVAEATKSDTPSRTSLCLFFLLHRGRWTLFGRLPFCQAPQAPTPGGRRNMCMPCIPHPWSHGRSSHPVPAPCPRVIHITTCGPAWACMRSNCLPQHHPSASHTLQRHTARRSTTAHRHIRHRRPPRQCLTCRSPACWPSLAVRPAWYRSAGTGIRSIPCRLPPRCSLSRETSDSLPGTKHSILYHERNLRLSTLSETFDSAPTWRGEHWREKLFDETWRRRQRMQA